MLEEAPLFVEHTGRAVTPPPGGPPPDPGAPRPPVNLPNDKTIAHSAFQQRWAASDRDAAGRTYVYGPAPFTDGLREPYANSPGGQRLVQYFDKARMEINDPASGVVTAGLLAVELISGRQQNGDDVFQPRGPARVSVASTQTTFPTTPTWLRCATARPRDPASSRPAAPCRVASSHRRGGRQRPAPN
jgi:hypothetical protein